MPPDDLVKLCGRYRVNFRPMLFAVAESLEDTVYFIVLARRRGHRRRPKELAFRVEGAAGRRHAFFPREQRLSSLGLRNLAAAAERAPHGGLIVGTDAEVELGLRGLPGGRSSDSLVGPVNWRAFRQGVETPYVAAVLNLDELLAKSDPKRDG